MNKPIYLTNDELEMVFLALDTQLYNAYQGSISNEKDVIDTESALDKIGKEKYRRNDENKNK